MLNNIIYYPIFGKPLIMYGGIITLLSFLATAFIPLANQKLKKKIPFKWHTRMAFVTIILVIVHAILGVLAFF